MLRLSLFALASLCALVLAGCPGSLDNPEQFLTDGGGGGGDCDAERDILNVKCTGSGCHGGGDGSPANDLDLSGSGLAASLLDAPASMSCEGELLIDGSDPSNSLIIDKVSSDMPRCGSRMPLLTDELTSAEISCLSAWLEEAAGGGGGSDGGAGGDEDGGASDVDGGT